MTAVRTLDIWTLISELLPQVFDIHDVQKQKQKTKTKKDIIQVSFSDTLLSNRIKPWGN